MKDQKTREKFIELRAQGLSFDKISKRIHTSKPTLINWDYEYANEIEVLKEQHYEEVLEKYKVAKQDRINRFAQALNKAWDAFERKDYSDLSKKELLLIITRLEKRLLEETDIPQGKDDKNIKDITVNIIRETIDKRGESHKQIVETRKKDWD